MHTEVRFMGIQLIRNWLKRLKMGPVKRKRYFNSSDSGRWFTFKKHRTALESETPSTALENLDTGIKALEALTENVGSKNSKSYHPLQNQLVMIFNILNSTYAD